MGQPPIGNQFGNRFGNQGFLPASIAADNARFMSSVYGWMTGGLCLTGAVAWYVSGNPELMHQIFGNRLLFWALIIAQLGAVAALSWLIKRISSVTGRSLRIRPLGRQVSEIPALQTLTAPPESSMADPSCGRPSGTFCPTTG